MIAGGSVATGSFFVSEHSTTCSLYLPLCLSPSLCLSDSDWSRCTRHTSPPPRRAMGFQSDPQGGMNGDMYAARSVAAGDENGDEEYFARYCTLARTTRYFGLKCALPFAARRRRSEPRDMPRQSAYVYVPQRVLLLAA